MNCRSFLRIYNKHILIIYETLLTQLMGVACHFYSGNSLEVMA